MITSIKALIVVLAIATVTFGFARPIALRFSSKSDFSRRRNVWFILTTAAFLSPNFWLFVLVAAPVLTWAGKKDSNPIALYLILLHVIPPIPVEIPVLVIKQLFPLDNYRLLSFCVLIPAAWRLRKLKKGTRIYGLTVMDLSIFAFALLRVLNYVPPDLPDHTILQDSATHVLRRTFLFFVDAYVLYFVASRSSFNQRSVSDALCAFCLVSALMASVSVFETLKSWLLYSDISTRWGAQVIYGSNYGVYSFRGGYLRAQASVGNSLPLGYLLAIAFGFWLYLSNVVSARLRIVIAILFWLGILTSQARGALLGAIVILLVFSLLGPRALPRLLKRVVVFALLVSAAGLTPFGGRIMNSIPFFAGSTDSTSVDYRQRLAERSWELIQLHPFLGDPLVMTKMEDLRQGEGIIDLVNTYAEQTLFYGIIGLAVFLAVILLGVFKAYRVSREIARRNRDYSLLGASLVACMIGTLFTLGTTSFLSAYEIIFYVLAGLAAGYAHVGKVLEHS